MQKHTSGANPAPVNVVLITLDNHMTAAVDDARKMLAADIPGLNLSVHAATDWNDSPERLQACKDDIAKGNIIVASMLFIEEHVKAIGPDLAARRDSCDAMMCCMSAGEIMKNTSMGRFKMDGEQKGPLAILKKLRGDRSKSQKDSGQTAGERQLAMLRRLPKLLRFIPGTAQDVRNYFIAMQYRIAASDTNIANLVRLLIDKYADGERRVYRGKLPAAAPVEYPDQGVYHPDIKGRVSATIAALPSRRDAKGTIGLLLLRSYILSGDTGHYDGVIRALERRGFNVVPVFCSGLDMRGPVRQFLSGGKTGVTIDAMLSLTGFSLVGGPAYSDAAAAAGVLADLDVPYVAAHVTEFQTIERWEASDQGLMPIETTIMVAIPELDGATGTMVFGGRTENDHGDQACSCARKLGTCPKGRSCMSAHPERVEVLAGRMEKLVSLRKTPRAERKVALTIFNFPPNAGNMGTAAFLSVFESLHATMLRMRDEGYTIEVPADPETLRDMVLNGNAASYGALANVHALISADDHVRNEKYLDEIEAAWGPAPGRIFSNGQSIFVLGRQFGNILVAVQPGFGYEGDPMRLLFEKGFAPTHAFAAFYTYLKRTYRADAVLHFGTHGALEFMPGKQSGMSSKCWPDRLIGDLPNFYLYAANNPSEGTIAKRRSAATLVSYLTPPVTNAGLYKGLSELKSSLDRLRNLDAGQEAEYADTFELVLAQAEALDLLRDASTEDRAAYVNALNAAMIELEYALIPHGLHVAGQAMSAAERKEMLQLIAEADDAQTPDKAVIEAIAAFDETAVKAARTGSEEKIALIDRLVRANANLADNRELDGIITALDGRFVAPSPSGDLLRRPDMLPTGRNIHGFDPFGIPSAYAVRDGARQAAKVLERYIEADGKLPETIAIVLWGTDNLKSEGGPMAQAMALMGARPRLDAYNRVCGAELIPLEELKRPRIDAVMTLSGIFRDLLPLQASMLAEASYLAATADEPENMNFVRKHALAYAADHDCDIEQAAYRVFSNAEGAYGANVNFLVGSSAWTDDQEIADMYTSRKGFAIDRKGKSSAQVELLNDVFAKVDMAYQNLDSVELGVTTIDHYFDTLGGISKAVSLAKGGQQLPVFISDQTQGEGRVRTLGEQVALETRTRSLNPKWFEGMLAHGYEGVRQIEAQISNTMGWSATTGDVQPWVYQKLSETFILDETMRRRLSELNPASSLRMVNRLIEAKDRNYWTPDDETWAALCAAGEEMEDRAEGLSVEAAE
ncbi:magnesium chelatase subunit H [Hoeflea olei]|uniref:magnesium chelatase n=1 Tax=Hoeflea olei TaxID=1480615 RepID=A0A1C1YYJ6_9HYPH|nr:magnesium chelatase subunit H [Hoeflea olei]OCW58476.1 magnesium chelatase [Hoeflea olei]